MDEALRKETRESFSLLLMSAMTLGLLAGLAAAVMGLAG